MVTRIILILSGIGVYAQVPPITDVLGAGSLLPDLRVPLCPGGRMSINFAADLFPRSAPSTPVISVAVAGKPAYVVAANPFSIDAQIPVEAPPGPTTITATVGGLTSAPFAINLQPYAPVLLSCFGTSRCDFASFLNASGHFASPQESASPGDTLTGFANCLGPTSPPTPTGPSPANTPTATPVILTIGGIQSNAGGPPVGGTLAPVSFAGLEKGSAGLYDVNFKVPMGLQGTQPIYLTVGGVTSSPVNIPLFGISSIVSNASFGSNGVAAPGSIISVFANGLGNVDQLSGFPATKFQGISVTFNGASAPLFHLTASYPHQIDLILPGELPAAGTVNVQLITPSGTSPNHALTMAPAVPAFYRLADPVARNRINVIAQFAGTAWLAMPTSMAAALQLPGNCAATRPSPVSLCGQPAAPGDLLVLYATGLGKATPNGDPNGPVLPTGAIPPADGSVLYHTVVKPIVTIGGMPALISYAGLAPGFPGLYQLNIQVPDSVALGDDVPVVVSLPGGAKDNTVTLAVQARTK